MSRIAPGTMIVVIFAILFGLVGAYAVQRQLAEKPEPQPEPEPEVVVRTIRIPLAAVDLEEGRTVTLGDVAIVSGKLEDLQAQFNLPGEYMRDPNQIIGRTIKMALKKGESFRPDRFYPQGSGPSMAARLPAGKRAITIHAAGAAAINGFASPSSIVDVLFRTEETEEYPETTVNLVEGAEVLALDRNLQIGAQGNSVATVTLAVTGDQANALKIAENKGEFSLALRNPDDNTLPVSTSKPQTLRELLNLPKPQKPFQAEVYRGTSKSTMSFERSDEEPGVRVANPIINRPQGAGAQNQTQEASRSDAADANASQPPMVAGGS